MTKNYKTKRITIRDTGPNAIIFSRNDCGGYCVKTIYNATDEKGESGALVEVISENARIKSIEIEEDT